jgi:hypothetical protein
MLVPAGAGGTVGADAGLVNQSQRPFEGWPQGQEFVQETLLEGGANIFIFMFHPESIACAVCIL